MPPLPASTGQGQRHDGTRARASVLCRLCAPDRNLQDTCCIESSHGPMGVANKNPTHARQIDLRPTGRWAEPAELLNKRSNISSGSIVGLVFARHAKPSRFAGRRPVFDEPGALRSLPDLVDTTQPHSPSTATTCSPRSFRASSGSRRPGAVSPPAPTASAWVHHPATCPLGVRNLAGGSALDAAPCWPRGRAGGLEAPPAMWRACALGGAYSSLFLFLCLC